MDAEDRGEGTSSRNGSAIEECIRGAEGRVQIRLEDGSSFFVSSEFADRNSLVSGSHVSDALLDSICAEDEKLRAFEKAVTLLARREHSVYELELKLRSRGFKGNSVSAALERLLKVGYVDDRRFAEVWVRTRLRRNPEGYSRLAAGLYRRGVDRGIVSLVLEEIYTEEESGRALEKAAEKILKRGNIERLAVLKKLTAKGFPYRQVEAHLQKLQLSD